MTAPEWKRIVAERYDRVADRFAAWAAQIHDPGREEWVARLDTVLPDGAHVLELGCGGANPSTKRLASRYRLTGVDISREQLIRARTALPDVEFLHGDFTAIDFAAESFEAVVCVHALNHVPREELPPLYARIARWLTPAATCSSARPPATHRRGTRTTGSGRRRSSAAGTPTRICGWFGAQASPSSTTARPS